MGDVADRLEDEVCEKSMLDQIRGLLEYGHSEKFICEHLDIRASSWQSWKRRDPEFKAMVADWRAYGDAQVERAVFERAVGCKRTKVVHKADGGVEETEEEVLGDPKAQAMWLGAHQPDKWSQKAHVEHSGSCDLRGLIGVLDDEKVNDALGDLLS